MLGPGVLSSTMKRLGLVLALVAIGAMVWYLNRPSHRQAAADDSPPPPRAPVSSPSSTPSPTTATTAPPPAGGPIDKVTKLADASARQRLAERIANAQAARAAVRAAPMPRLPDGSGAPTEDKPAITPTEIRTAMREAIPYIKSCYQAAIPTLANPDFKMTAELTLTGDPDVGTIIDAKQLVDDTGKPLPAALDDCFRNEFMLLALPPLAEGDQVVVRYPFGFRTN